jgi:DNA mismatch repair protein MutL
VTDHAKTNCTPGTRVQADEIFANLPARRKFLKSAAGELRRVAAIIREYAICRPEVAFALENDARPVFSTDGSGQRRRAIEQLWGASPKIQEVEVSSSAGRIKLECWWQPRIGPGGRNEIASFVNGRSVSDPVIKGAVSAAARELVGGWALLFSVDPSLVDVNIHPAKAEIRFRYPGDVFEAVKEAAGKLGAPAAMGDRPWSNDGKAAASSASQAGKARGNEGWAFAADFSEERPSVGAADKASQSFSFQAGPTQAASFRAESPEGGAVSKSVLFSGIEAPDFEAPDFENRSLLRDGEALPKEGVPVSDFDGSLLEEALEETKALEEGGFSSGEDRCQDGGAYLGQLASGYLVFDAGDGLVVMDPHAAHERVEFERIREAAKEGARSQRLLVPSPIPPTLQLEVEERREFLESVGFVLETVEGGARLTAVPCLPDAVVPPDALLRGTIATLRDGGTGDLTELLWRCWATMACRDAVKVTTKLESQEAEALWKNLFDCERPFCCPHGRPTVLRFSDADLRRHFGRE